LGLKTYNNCNLGKKTEKRAISSFDCSLQNRPTRREEGVGVGGLSRKEEKVGKTRAFVGEKKSKKENYGVVKTFWKVL